MSADILARLEDFYAHRSLARHADAWSEEIAVAWPALLRVLRAAEAFERVMDGLETEGDVELVEFRAAVAELRGGGA